MQNMTDVGEVQQRKEFFQWLILGIERKYAITTKQAIGMMNKEMREATSTEDYITVMGN